MHPLALLASWRCGATNRRIGSFVQVVALIGGLASAVALVGSLLFLGRQTLLANQLAEAQSVTTFYEANDRVLRHFLDYPELRPYFYDNTEFGNEAPIGSPTYVRAMTVAELLADSIENSYVAASSVPAIARRLDDLRIYAVSLLESSPALREFVSDRASWYAHLPRELAKLQLEDTGLTKRHS